MSIDTQTQTNFDSKVNSENKESQIKKTEIASSAPKSADLGDFKVNKKGFIETSGEIIETLPSITFRVKLENGQEITARLAGKMRMNRIMLLPGDKVKVEMSPYDLTKGRIFYRF